MALLYTLQNLASSLHNARLDVFVDSKVLVASWERQVSKSPVISATLKSLFTFCASRNLGLSLQHVPSEENPADVPSRVISDLDATLSEDTWRILERSFGPHSIDLMALPTNARCDSAGRRLRFFSPLPCQEAYGTNIFSQQLAPNENAYVFPPFLLVGPLLRHLAPQGCAVTMVVPDLYPRKYWWPLLQRKAIASLKLGSKGNRSVLFFPSKKGPAAWESRPLLWDLWAFRIPAECGKSREREQR